MSYGFSASEIFTCVRLCQTFCTAIKKAASDYAAFLEELNALSKVLEQVADFYKDISPNDKFSSNKLLMSLMQCHSVLKTVGIEFQEVKSDTNKRWGRALSPRRYFRCSTEILAVRLGML